MRHRPAPRVAWLGAAAILVAAALVALAAILKGDFSDTDGRILGSLAAVLYTGGALFAGLATVDRGRPTIGWALSGSAVVSFVVLLASIWEATDEWEWGLTVIVALLAGLMLATALLLARTRTALSLASVAGVLAGLAAASTIAAIWADDSGDGWAKTITALWILGILAYVLVPVVERFGRAGAPSVERVLAVSGDVELVATTTAGAAGLDPKLAPGERLVLRRRPSATSL
jgi:hypothetical protein